MDCPRIIIEIVVRVVAVLCHYLTITATKGTKFQEDEDPRYNEEGEEEELGVAVV